MVLGEFGHAAPALARAKAQTRLEGLQDELHQPDVGHERGRREGAEEKRDSRVSAVRAGVPRLRRLGDVDDGARRAGAVPGPRGAVAASGAFALGVAASAIVPPAALRLDRLPRVVGGDGDGGDAEGDARGVSLEEKKHLKRAAREEARGGVRARARDVDVAAVKIPNPRGRRRVALGRLHRRPERRDEPPEDDVALPACAVSEELLDTHTPRAPWRRVGEGARPWRRAPAHQRRRRALALRLLRRAVRRGLDAAVARRDEPGRTTPASIGAAW